MTNTVDSDTIVDNLFDGCFKAGHKVCALARSEDKSTSDVSGRFWAWLKQLDESPVAGVGPSGNSVILTGGDIRLVLTTSAYSPIQTFVLLSELLNNAMAKEIYDPLFAIIEAGIVPALQDGCPIANHTMAPNQDLDAQSGVLCLDGEDISGKPASWWTRYVEKQVSQSSVFGAFWSGIRLACSGWRFKPHWTFRGPFTSPEATKPGEKLEKGRPAAPLMFLTNRLDPVTPLAAARAMAKNHPGAKVVVQEAMGHCATFSAYSSCTKKIVADYFDTGKLPDEEVACEAECGPWDEGCGKVVAQGLGTKKWYARKFPLGIEV